MTTMVSVPVIRSAADLVAALARIDEIIDALDGSPESDERATLGTLIAAYEDEHHPFPTLSGVALLVCCMEAQGMTQAQMPEIGPQPLVSAVLAKKRVINPRMAMALGRRFCIPPACFLSQTTSRPKQSKKDAVRTQRSRSGPAARLNKKRAENRMNRRA